MLPLVDLCSINNNHNVEGYTYADWEGSLSDIRSTFGYFTFLGANFITRRSKNISLWLYLVLKQILKECLRVYVN